MSSLNMIIPNMKTRSMKLPFQRVIKDIPLTSSLLNLFINPVTLESYPILFICFANDCKFKTNIVGILSEVTFVSIFKNKQ